VEIGCVDTKSVHLHYIKSNMFSCTSSSLWLVAIFLMDLGSVDGKKDNQKGKETDAPQPPGCNLCEMGSVGLKWPHHKIDPHGTTCVQHLLDIYVLDPKSTACRWQIIRHRARCCSGDVEPKEIEQEPTNSPYYQGSGDNVW
jgi:hypothetical protein